MESSDALVAAFEKLSTGERAKFLSLARGMMDSDGSGVPASLRAYDDYCASSVTPFLAICVKLGADCAEVSKLVEKMFAQQRGVIETATKCKEPDQAGLKDVFGGVVATMKEINASVRRNAMENNVKTISEGMQALNWMVVRPAPVDFMTSYIDGSDMWSNRIRKEFKGVNEDQISFCVLFKTMMNELRAYVKEHHTTGLTWNPKGVAVAEYAGASAPSIAVAAPVTAAVKSAPAPAHAEGPVKSGLFSALAQGEGVTSGLKKVTKDQQTWRAEFNKDAAVPVVSAAPKKAAEAAGPKKSAVATGEPKFALQGDKWVLDFQTGGSGPLTVKISDIKQTVYLYKCDGVSVTVEGKCKSIIIDSCLKVALSFADAVAGLEIVNSRSSKVVCSVKVPSVAIDKCDGVHLTLAATSLDAEIVASKSSEMNVCFPDPDAAGEMLERPIPEQYVHKIEGKNVSARVSDLYTH